MVAVVQCLVDAVDGRQSRGTESLLINGVWGLACFVVAVGLVEDMIQK